jgi:hypothetical protein
MFRAAVAQTCFDVMTSDGDVAFLGYLLLKRAGHDVSRRQLISSARACSHVMTSHPRFPKIADDESGQNGLNKSRSFVDITEKILKRSIVIYTGSYFEDI